MVKVLTSKGGDYQISDELRNMLVLLDNGSLIIAKTYAQNPHVRGFVSRLQRLGVEHTVQYADLSVVLDHYSTDKTKVQHTDMQNAAKTLFEHAVSMRASDIHIRVSKRQRTQIFFRVHNDLEFAEEHPFEYGEKLCSTIYQAMADVSDSTFEQLSRQDARISERSKLPLNLDGIRIATSPQVDGYVMVLRLLYNDTSADLDLVNLGYNADQADVITLLKKKPTGIIVIGGPTGSGKSTTLQRVLASIILETQGRKHIITVEDPPEYPIPGAVQTPVANADTEEIRSAEFQKAIKASMRLDPDIIMLSEVRDKPSARLSVQAAMTGHQVWTTVHANSAIAIVDRFKDLGVDGELLTDPTIVAGLICQRLVKKMCPHCKRKLMDVADQFNLADIARVERVVPLSQVYVQGEGCSECRHTGVMGRTVVAETVMTDNNLMALIKRGERMAAIDYIRYQLGSISMLQHAIQKVGEGVIDPFQAEDIVGLLDAELPMPIVKAGG